MLKPKRLFVLSGLTALAGAAAFAAPASADKGECLINGDIKTHDKLDPTLGPRFVGGEAKFTFRELAIECVGDIDKDGVPELIPDVGLTATGWFDNTVCGTGKALGTVVGINNAPAKLDAALTGAKFGIEFVGFTGVFKWHEPSEGPLKDLVVHKEDPFSDDPRKQNDPKAYSPAGMITLGLSHDKPTWMPDIAAGECVKAFSATGDIKITF